jgi:hypothetical protein
MSLSKLYFNKISGEIIDGPTLPNGNYKECVVPNVAREIIVSGDDEKLTVIGPGESFFKENKPRKCIEINGQQIWETKLTKSEWKYLRKKNPQNGIIITSGYSFSYLYLTKIGFLMNSDPPSHSEHFYMIERDEKNTLKFTKYCLGDKIEKEIPKNTPNENGPTIAIIDTGVCKSITSCTRVGNVDDSHGHGTMIFGIIVQIAPGIKLT